MGHLTKRLAAAALATLAVATQATAFGDMIVAPNANTAVVGTSLQYNVLGSIGSAGATSQIAYDSSQFSGMAVGSTITGIGFRLPAGAITYATALSYTDYSISVATAALPVDSLSATFANNVSADDTLVRSGALTIPANSFVGGAGPNPFFELAFTTGFVYHGGSLVVTFRHASPGVNDAGVDANTIPASPSSVWLKANGNTVVDNSSSTSSVGQVGYYNVPITNFYFTPGSAVPEPASIVSSGAAVLMTGLSLAWRRRRAAA